MRRTITVKEEYVFYRDNRIGWPLPSLKNHFGLRSSKKYKYVITITLDKKGEYIFKRDTDLSWFDIYKNGEDVCHVCIEDFEKLFKIKTNKRYNITVKKVLRK